MIEQQYYTRERGGLFNQTDGYDTVAKSPQLKLDYIKKNLHPLCSYDIPYELQKSGEADESKYPSNFMVVPLETGETIVGQAIYKSKDFTGLRSTFFMHNLIFSGKERRRYIKEPEKLFGISGFAKSYENSEGKELPTLAAIPYEVPELFKDRERLLQELGMTEEVFLKLVAACFTVVHSKKKIFIVLNVPLGQFGDYAKALLYHVYSVLPWSVAECLGVSTYSGKAEPRKNIQITFIDQNALQTASRISKEYIFDFVNQRISGCEENVENEAYMRLALPYAKNKVAWEKYNKLADGLAEAVKNKGKLDLAFYGRVALLFEMNLFMKSNRRYEVANSKMRKGLLKELMGYAKEKLSDELLAEITELIEYSIMLLHEPINRGFLWDEEEVKALLQYKLQVHEGSKDHLSHCEQVILCLLTEATKEKKEAYADEVLRQVRYFLSFYQQIIGALYADHFLRRHILYRQIENQIMQVSSVEGLMSMMERWEVVEELILEDAFYKDSILKGFQSIMGNTPDKLQMLSVIQRWCHRHEGSLYEDIQDLYESYFLEKIDLDKELKDERTLLSLNFAHDYREESYEVITQYQRLKKDIGAMSPRTLRINMKVQELIKKYYRQNPRKEEFYLIVYAFLNSRREDGEVVLQIKRVLGYLNNIHSDLMFAFIIWSKGQEVYIDKKKFDGQVISFFMEQKEKKEKIPNDLIKEKLGSHGKTQLLAQKIIKAQQPKFIRFLSRNKGGVIVVSCLLVIAVSVGGASYCYYLSQQKKAQEAMSTVQEADPASLMVFEKDFQWYKEHEESDQEMLKRFKIGEEEKEEPVSPIVRNGQEEKEIDKQ